jgi:hypothetical protein
MQLIFVSIYNRNVLFDAVMFMTFAACLLYILPLHRVCTWISFVRVPRHAMNHQVVVSLIIGIL